MLAAVKKNLRPPLAARGLHETFFPTFRARLSNKNTFPNY
jgi:hypothetical protein